MQGNKGTERGSSTGAESYCLFRLITKIICITFITIARFFSSTSAFLLYWILFAIIYESWLHFIEDPASSWIHHSMQLKQGVHWHLGYHLPHTLHKLWSWIWKMHSFFLASCNLICILTAYWFPLCHVHFPPSLCAQLHLNAWCIRTEAAAQGSSLLSKRVCFPARPGVLSPSICSVQELCNLIWSCFAGWWKEMKGKDIGL